MAKLFKRKGCENWYFFYTLNGKKVQKSTGTDNLKQAEAFRDRFLCADVSYLGRTLQSVLEEWANLETCPKKIESLREGFTLSHSYIYEISLYANQLIKFLKKEQPLLLSLDMAKITKSHILKIRELSMEKIGRNTKSASFLRVLKLVFDYAYSKNYVDINACDGVKPIHLEHKKRTGITTEMIAFALEREDAFPSHDNWLFFVILSLTGMRRGEAIALNKNNLNDGIYTVDRQLTKIGSKEGYDSPKCNLNRTIPLCKTLLTLLEKEKTDKDGFYLKQSIYKHHYQFQTAMRVLAALDVENSEAWKKVTPHVLRHSMNTNLLIAGMPALLVAEYMSWKHQELIDMQARYTHFVAKNLQPIADKIDEMYTPSKELKLVK